MLAVERHRFGRRSDGLAIFDVQQMQATVPGRRINDVLARGGAGTDGDVCRHAARTKDTRASSTGSLFERALEIALPQQLARRDIDRVYVIGDAGLDDELFRSVLRIYTRYDKRLKQ